MVALTNPNIAYRLSGAADDAWTIVEVTDGAAPEILAGLAEDTYEVSVQLWSAGTIFQYNGLYDSLTLTPDFWVDGAAGLDTNAGTSEAAAFKSLSKASSVVYGTVKAGRVIVRVKAGTYSTADDYFLVSTLAAAVNDGLTVVFEPGVIMDGVNMAGSENGFEFDTPTAWPTIVYGNGLIVRNYVDATAASPNGFGNRGSHDLSVYNAHVENCEDGFSAHGQSTMRLYDCTAQTCTKTAVAHVNTATAEHYRCVFTGLATAVGIAVVEAGVTATFEDTQFFSSPTVINAMSIASATSSLTRCQFGSLTRQVTLNGNGFAVNDSFLNVYVQLSQTMEFQRCYGFASFRQRNGGGLTLENSVIAGPATGYSSIFYADFDSGAGSPHIVRNNIFETATATAFMAYDATNSGYVVAAGSQFHNNILSGSAAFDADLIAADTGGTVLAGNVTADALIGVANTLAPNDYGYAAGSPAIGAATDGGNSGFAIGAVATPTPPKP